MKKILSFILSICILMMSGTYSVFASDIDSNEVILSVNDAEWTLPDGLRTLSMGGYGEGIPCVAAVGTDNAELTTEQLDKNIYVTYSNIPQGVYKVEYFYPNFNGSNATGRNAQILDNDIIVTDANGTHEINSIKPSVTYSGWVDIGTYEFGGSQNSIKVTVNQDNKYFRGQWNRYFCSSQVKLIPVTEDHSALLTAVNAAADKATLKRAVIDNANGFVNISALKYMDDMYDELIKTKPQSGWSSVYAFKTAFENEIDKSLTTKIISSSSFVWQNTSVNANNYGYRINWSPIELGNGEGARAIVTFKLSDVQNMKAMRLRLKRYEVSPAMNNAVKITKYSTSKIDVASTSKEQNKNVMANAIFTDLTAGIPITLSAKEIDNTELIAAAKKDGYISFYIESDEISYQSIANVANKYAENAELEIISDDTTNPNINITEAAVNSKAVNSTRIFDLSGFDTVAAVAVNDIALNTEKYAFKDNRLKIEGDVFDEAGSYTVTVSNGAESKSTGVTVSTDTVLADSNREITVPSGANKQNFNASEWNIVGNTMDAYVYADTCNAENTYATYKNIPQGAYEVYYCTPSFKGASVPNKRNLSVLDNSISVKDKNGTTVTESVKTSVSGGALVNLGTYEFAGSANDSIRVFVNDEHNVMNGGQYSPLFVPGGLILKPAANNELAEYYFNNGKTYLEAVNGAETSNDLEKIISSNSFVDANALYSMQTVYEELVKHDYSSAYEFKKAFETEVEKNITTKIYTAQVLSQNEDNSIRPLSSNQTLHKNYYLATTFKDVDKENIVSAEIKLNAKVLRADAVISGYSYAKYDRPVDDSLTVGNNLLSQAKAFVDGFTTLTTPIAAAMADRAEISPLLFEGITKDKYISFKFKLSGEILTEQTSINANEYTKDATLTVHYDNTVIDKTEAAKRIANASTLDEAKSLADTYKDLLGLNDADSSNRAAVILWGESISSEADFTALMDKANDKDVLLSNAEYSEDGKVTVTVKNISANEQPLSVIAATYSAEQQMIEAVPDGVNTKISGLSTLSIPIALADNNFETLKVFAFDSMTSIKPYDNAFLIEKLMH